MFWDNYETEQIGLQVAENTLRPIKERAFSYILENDDGRIKTGRRNIRGVHTTALYYDRFYGGPVGYVPKGVRVKSGKHMEFPKKAIETDTLIPLTKGMKLVYEFYADEEDMPDTPYAVTNKIVGITLPPDPRFREIRETEEYRRWKESKIAPFDLPLPL